MKIYQTVYTVTSNQNNLKDKIDLYTSSDARHLQILYFIFIIRLCSNCTPSSSWYTHQGITFAADTNERKNERLPQKWNFDCINYSEFVKEIYQQRTCLSIVQFVLALKLFFCFVILWFEVCTTHFLILWRKKRQWKSWCNRQWNYYWKLSTQTGIAKFLLIVKCSFLKNLVCNWLEQWPG